MILGVDFPESNFTLLGGSDDVYDLKAYRQIDPLTGYPFIITKFQMDVEDLQALIENGGSFYIRFLGSTIPPVSIFVESPF